jgi:hypothetical protein
VVCGWLAAGGPAWRDEATRAAVSNRLLRMLRRVGLRRWATRDELESIMLKACAQWQQLRARVQEQWATLRAKHGLTDQRLRIAPDIALPNCSISS